MNVALLLSNAACYLERVITVLNLTVRLYIILRGKMFSFLELLFILSRLDGVTQGKGGERGEQKTLTAS